MTESVTWETCPTCDRCAAVGWHDELPVGFDCPNGCQLSTSQMLAFSARRRIAAGWLNGT